MDCNHKLILGLVWTLILHFQVGGEWGEKKMGGRGRRREKRGGEGKGREERVWEGGGGGKKGEIKVGGLYGRLSEGFTELKTEREGL